MAVNKKLLNHLIDTLKCKDDTDLIKQSMRNYFYPKILNSVFHYISFGFKTLKNLVLSENREGVPAAERMLTFIKRQVKEALLRPNSRNKIWKCLTNIWNFTKSLIEMDSDVDFSEFASWLLRSLIDFGAEAKYISHPGEGFNIEKNLSFIDDQFGNSSSLNIVLKLKSVFHPNRKRTEVIYAIASYVFKYHIKTPDIEKFLTVILLAKIVLNRQTCGSRKAKVLLESFLKKAVLPPDFFQWAEHHLMMKRPKGAPKMKGEKIFLYILKHLDYASAYNFLQSKKKKSNLSKEIQKNMKVYESEGVIKRNVQMVATGCQNDLKRVAENCDIIISSSGAFQISLDTNSEVKENPRHKFRIIKKKKEGKGNKNSKRVSQEYDIHTPDQMCEKRQTSTTVLNSCLSKELMTSKNVSVNSKECREEKICNKSKRKQSDLKRNTLNHEEGSIEPSFKRTKTINKSESEFISTSEKTIVNSNKIPFHLPPECMSIKNPKVNSKKFDQKGLPIIDKIPNQNVNGLEFENTKQPNVLSYKKSFNHNSESLEAKYDSVKNKYGKRKLDNSTFKSLKSKPQPSENFGQANENLLKDLNKKTCENRSKGTFFNKLDASTKPLKKLRIKCRRKKNVSDNPEKRSVQGCIENKTKEPFQKYNKTNYSDVKIKENGLAKKEKESEVDEASGSDSDIVPNDLEHSMFTKEETLAYHQLQLKELKDDERRQKLKVIFGKVIDSRNADDSNGKLDTNEVEERKSESNPVHCQDVLSSLYKKILNPEHSQNETEKSEAQNSPTEELPYGNDNIEDLEVVYSTIERDLKNKKVCEIKKEISSEEDSIPFTREKEKPMKSSSNSECHPDNVFNIYSKKSITVINLDAPITTKGLPNFNQMNQNDEIVIDPFETNLSLSKDKNKKACVTFENPSVLSKNALIEEDFGDKLNGSLWETCKEDKPEQCHVFLSGEVETGRGRDEFTGNEVETSNTSQRNVNENVVEIKKSKEVSKVTLDDLEDSSSSLILSLDESAEVSCENNSNETDRTCDNIKSVSDVMLDKGINTEIISNVEILKECIESTSVCIDITSENTSQISKKILEQKHEKKNVDNEIASKIANINEAEESSDFSQNTNVNSKKDSYTIINCENEVDGEIFKENEQMPTNQNLNFTSNNSFDLISSEIKSLNKKNSPQNVEEEKPVDESQKSKLCYRKALTYDSLQKSTEQEQGSEFSKSGVAQQQNQIDENMENKENIVNNKQEEIAELCVSSNSVNKEFSEKEKYTHSYNESPKTNATKYKSPMKRKSISENALVPKDHVICLTPLKVASAALSSEIIISPDVSDEENTARAINPGIEEENIIQSISGSIGTLSQAEEEQIRDEDQSNANLRDENGIYKDKNLADSPPERAELSPKLTTRSQSKLSPKLVLSVNSVLQKRETVQICANSSVVRTYVTRKSPLAVKEKSLNEVSKDSIVDENIELSSVGTKRDEIDASTSKSDNSSESQEELERKDTVPSPIRTRYSLRRPRNTTTPVKQVMKPIRSRRNSVSSVKSDNEIEVIEISSPSAKSLRSLTAGNLTPVRRSRRISGLSQDKI